jgi:hypothetical protein
MYLPLDEQQDVAVLVGLVLAYGFHHVHIAIPVRCVRLLRQANVRAGLIIKFICHIGCKQTTLSTARKKKRRMLYIA